VQRIGSAVLAAGPHSLSLTDFQFPAALTQIGAAVTLDGQSVVTATTAGSTPFTATAGEHAFYGFGSTASTGVFGIVVAPAAGPAVFTKLTSVNTSTPGATPAFSYAVDVATAGAYRVHLADFEFPGRVTGTQLAVAQAGAGSLLGSLSAPGTLELPTVAAGRVFIFVLAQPTTNSGGLIGVDMVPAAGGDALFETTQGVGALFDSRKVSAPGAASYRVSLTDVEFPKKFADLSAAITRGTQKLGVVLGSTHTDFDATAGNYFITLIATPDATETAGTYGVRVFDKPANPTVTFTSSVPQVTVGSTVTLTWSATNATSCQASGAWSGSRALSGSETSSAISSPSTFTLACTGDGGTTTKSVDVAAAAQSNKGGGGALGWLLVLFLGTVKATLYKKSKTVLPAARRLRAS